MIDLLSLPRRPRMGLPKIRELGITPGLPLNSLPGWELIPLNSKLPMLKCPDNQVIFSKNKIGQTFKYFQQEFDASPCDKLPEYNALHDSNLKRFYSIERNLKRLRQNGEITPNNDVICTLKDFNEFRQQLHRATLYYVLREMSRADTEQRDRGLITNAEGITVRDHRHLDRRRNSNTEIQRRKRKQELLRMIRFQRMMQKTEVKIARRAAIAEMERKFYEHKKVLNELKMQRHMQTALDIERIRMILLKKQLQLKLDRLEKNLREVQEGREKRAEEIQNMFWEKRLHERITNQAKMKELLARADDERQVFINRHRELYKQKWEKIDEQIRMRARLLKQQSKLAPRVKKLKKKKKKKVQPVPAKPSNSGLPFCDRYEENFDKLMEHELCEALNTALDLEENMKLPIDVNDPIYKAAKFIITHIIQNFDKDLSKDGRVCKQVMPRVSRFIEDAKAFVIFRSSQIIGNIRDQSKDNLSARSMDLDSRRPTLVSFSTLPRTIGTSSYDIHPLMILKPSHPRTPTPVGSLASIKVDSETRVFAKSELPQLCRNELIFIEHYMIKFKRELITGIGKRVFAAIEGHFHGKETEVRPELLRLDRKFLACQMTKAILSYATNPLNYEATIKLCISTMANEVIFSLQKYLLKKEPKPIGMRACFGNQCFAPIQPCIYCNP